jgi:polygalacturonase
VYTTGTIVLKDHVTLRLEAGAVFYLSRDKADFPGARAHVVADGARNIYGGLEEGASVTSPARIDAA